MTQETWFGLAVIFSAVSVVIALILTRHRKNTFKVGEYAWAWVWAESTEHRVPVRIVSVDEEFCYVEYLDRAQLYNLALRDSSFIFPVMIPFRDITHMANDEVKQLFNE